jgi:hypothetical protein
MKQSFELDTESRFVIVMLVFIRSNDVPAAAPFAAVAVAKFLASKLDPAPAACENSEASHRALPVVPEVTHHMSRVMFPEPYLLTSNSQ